MSVEIKQTTQVIVTMTLEEASIVEALLGKCNAKGIDTYSLWSSIKDAITGLPDYTATIVRSERGDILPACTVTKEDA